MVGGEYKSFWPRIDTDEMENRWDLAEIANAVSDVINILEKIRKTWDF